MQTINDYIVWLEPVTIFLLMAIITLLSLTILSWLVDIVFTKAISKTGETILTVAKFFKYTSYKAFARTSRVMRKFHRTNKMVTQYDNLDLQPLQQQLKELQNTKIVDIIKFPDDIEETKKSLIAELNDKLASFANLMKSIPNRTIPEIDEGHVQQEYNRKSYFAPFVIFSFLAVAFIIFNTSLLNKFFFALGFTQRTLFDIPVALGMAFIFSLAELAMGGALAYKKAFSSSHLSNNISILTSLFWSVILCFAIFEFSLYALTQIEGDYELFGEIIANLDIQKFIANGLFLGFLGFGIVIGLSVCGELAIFNFFKHKEHSNYKTLIKSLNKINDDYQKIKAENKDLNQFLKSMPAEIKKENIRFDKISQAKNYMKEHAELIKNGIAEIIETIKGINNSANKKVKLYELSEHETARLFGKNLIIIILPILAIFLAARFLPPAVRDLATGEIIYSYPYYLRLGIAVLTLGGLYLVGYMVKHKMNIFENAGNGILLRKFAKATYFEWAIGIVAISLSGVIYYYLLISNYVISEQSMLNLLLIVLAMFVTLLCGRFAPLAPTLLPLFQYILFLLQTILCMIISFIFYLMGGLILLITAIISYLALPSIYLFKKIHKTWLRRKK